MFRLTIVLAVLINISTAEFSINWTSRPELDKEYLTHYVKGNFHTAKSYCDKHGGILPQIMSQMENDFISRLIPTGQEIWLGAKNVGTRMSLNSSKEFVWLDESELKYSNWAEHNPFGNCEAIYLNSDGKWQSAFSYSFSDNHFVVCERIKNPERTLQELKTTELLKAVMRKLDAIERDVREIKGVVIREGRE